jgi:hypothetical protein
MIIHQGTRENGAPVTVHHITSYTCVDCDHYFEKKPLIEPSHTCANRRGDPMYEHHEHWIVATEKFPTDERISARVDSYTEALTLFNALIGPITQLTLPTD